MDEVVRLTSLANNKLYYRDCSAIPCYEVRLDLFDGPIDLLLHLVKQNELPIEKISLAQVALQYAQCIEQMRDLDLEVAGEYLVIAATLLSIKSSLLLNEPVQLVPDEEGNLVDPHAELLRRLKEAEIYKEAASNLATRHLLGVDVFAPPQAAVEGEEIPVRFRPHDATLLGRAFQKLLQKLGEHNQVFQVSVEQISIVERMVHLLDKVRAVGGRLSFMALLGSVRDRGVLVGSFIALLELCKRQVIEVHQADMLDEIYIVLSSGEASASSPDGALTSEFDDQVEEGVRANG